MRNNEQYELVSGHEFDYHAPGQDPYGAFRPPDYSDHAHHDPYSLTSLDADWFPLLQDKLYSRKESKDSTDFGLRHHSTGPPRPTVEDEIDGRGKFQFHEVEEKLRSMPEHELEGRGLSRNKIREILLRAKRKSNVDSNGEIDFRVFLETMKRYRLSTEQEGTLKEIAAAFAYAEEFTCIPPTVFMISITLIEMAFFIYMCVHLSSEHDLQITWSGPVPYCSVLIYNPERRYEAWRYFTYMFVHIGISHFVFNMIMQILVGVFLEMEQEGWVGSLRIATVYICGVLAGSLGTSLSDPYTYIAGASGGVYALIAAHLATLALNWQEDSAVRIKKVIHRPLTRIVRLTFIILLTIHDVSLAIYLRVTADKENRTGFMGHLCGAIAGLLVGIFVLENRRVRKWEPCVQWISFTLFMGMVTFAVLWNIFGDEWSGTNFYPPSDRSLYDDENGECQKYFY